MADRPKRAVPPGDSPAVRPVEPGTGAPPPRPGPPRRDAEWVRRLPAVLALCAVAVVGVLLVRYQAPDEPAAQATTTPSTAPPTSATFRDPEGRFRVGVPAGWRLLTEDTPTLNGYLDVFSAATFATRSLIGSCSHLPMQALEDMGAGDAFVWVEQGSASWERATRPASFADIVGRGTDEDLEAYTCLSSEGRSDLGVLQWFSFTDAGLSYWGVVAAGLDASEERIAETVAVLDSFDPAARLGLGTHVTAVAGDEERVLAITAVGVGPQPPDRGTVHAFDPDTGEMIFASSLDGAPMLVSGDSEAVWVAHSGTGNLSRLNPETGIVEDEVALELPYDLGGTVGTRFVPQALAVDDGALWALTGFAAIAEVRDGGRDVAVHELITDQQLRALEVVAGTPWVASGRAVYGFRPGNVTVVELDHFAEDLAVDGDHLLVAGQSSAGVSLASVIDTTRGEVVGDYAIDAPIAGVVTIEGVTGVLDVEGVLHTAAGEARPTDAPIRAVLGQAGPQLWASPDQTSLLFDVHFLEPRPAEPVAVQLLPEDVLRSFEVVADADDRFRVAVPPGWTVTTESLSPLGGAGGDLFGAGTFEMRPTAETCVHLPTQALEDMGSADAFVWVEAGGSLESGTTDPPGSFADLIEGVDENSMPFGCLTARDRADLSVLHWISFSRAGSNFHAIIAVGRHAPAVRVSEAVAVLDSFDPSLRLGLGVPVIDLGWDGRRIWAIAGNSVKAIDPISGARDMSLQLHGTPTSVGVDGDSVWVAQAETGNLVRIDPGSGRITAEVELGPFFDGAGPDGTAVQADALVVGGGVAWALSSRGALAEVRDGGGEVTVHELRTDDQLHALAVVEGAPWVGSGRAAYRFDGGDVTQVTLDHIAERLGTDGDRLLVAGQVPGGGNRVTSIDADTGEIAGAFDVAGQIVGIVTVEGMTGALDTTGTLHVEDGAVALTDLVPSEQPMVQAGADLYVATSSGLRRVRLLGQGSRRSPGE